MLSGKLKIHRASGSTRPCSAVVETPSGSLAVWDDLPEEDWCWNFNEGLLYPMIEVIDTGRLYEPDMLAKPEKWERVERKGHSWLGNVPYQKDGGRAISQLEEVQEAKSDRDNESDDN